MPRLVIIEGRDKGETFEFEKEASIGRSASNLIKLSESRISRRHAHIFLREGDWIVRDCRSRNGVFVNGRAHPEARLAAGDEVQVGNTKLVFEAGPSSRPAPEQGRSVVLMDDAAPEGVVHAALDAAACSLAQEKAGVDLDDLFRANERLRKVYEIGAAISTLLEPNELVERILGLILEALEADRGFIMLRDHPRGELKPVAVRAGPEGGGKISLSRTILNRVVKHQKSILSADAMEDPRFRGSESIQLAQVRSVMCVPLMVRDQVLGALYVDKTRPHHSFDGEDLKFLTTVAHQAAAFLDTARMYALAREENRELRRILGQGREIVGSSPKTAQVLAACEKVGPTDSTVLLAGETGTGKELLARFLHDQSPRQEGPFVTVNCAAVPETLLESELFGHEKGAFTGAHRRKRGRFELADGGTLFLDEIGEIPLALQSKLLRVLEARTFERLGSNDPVSVDVRIVAATNRDLPASVKEGAFREDLYYRLAVVPIHVPPLRERPEDVADLVEHFLDEFRRTVGKNVTGFTAEALAALKAYAWPGNIRELKNLVERVVVLAEGGKAGLESLPAHLMEGAGIASGPAPSWDGRPLAEIVCDVERVCIEKALERAGGKKIEAARLLGISRPTLDKKLKAFGLF